MHIVRMCVRMCVRSFLIMIFLENGSDYDAGPGLFNVTIKKGENSAIFYINITDDEVYENGDDNHGEDFSLDIIASSLEPVGSIHLGHTSKTRVIILDDECK